MTPGYINNVSVVVATRHDAEQVENRISAMLPSSGVELIVVYDEGRGVSYARNLGLEHADGKWVLFIDDDDHIDPSIFNTLNHRLSNTTDTIDRIGIIEWGYNIVDGNKIQTVKLADEPEIFSSANLVELMVDNKRFTSNLWNKLIRRELIGTLRFNESLSYGEDWDFLWRLISATTTLDMLIIPDILYDYQQHAQQVSAGFNKAKLTLPAAWTTMLHDISTHHPSLLGEARATFASQLTVSLYSAYRSHTAKAVTRPLRKALRIQLPQLWKSPRHSLKKKLAATWLSL